jgi:hypothetical protein
MAVIKLREEIFIEKVKQYSKNFKENYCLRSSSISYNGRDTTLAALDV